MTMRRSARFGERLFVRDQHHRGALLAIEREQQFEHGAPGGGVEIAGRLVGQQDRRPQGKGAGERDALLFAAGELHRVVIEAAFESDAVEQFAGAVAAARCRGPREFHRAAARSLRRSAWGSVGRTGKRSRFCGPRSSAISSSPRVGDVLAVQDDLAAGRRIEPGKQAEQRALPAAGRAHDRGELAARDLEVDAFEDVHTVGAGVDGFGERANLDQTFIMAFR